MLNDKLKGKNVVITGASSGIGEKIAYLVAEQGATPFLLARSEKRLIEIADTINKKHNVPCYTFKVDIGDMTAIQAVFEEINRVAETIDILVNNAGFGVFADIIDADLSETKAMFDVNVLGLITCTKQVLPRMLSQNNGHIINIASLAGKLATPKSSVYSATKHAVLGFTNALRLELADHKIFVTAVNPGPIKTRFFDIADQSGTYVKNVEKFMLDPDDVASKIVRIMLTNKRELNLPGWMNLGSIFYTLFPGVVEKVGGKAIFKK